MSDVWLPMHVLASRAEALSLDNLHGAILVVNLFGGVSLWDLVQFVEFDWSIVSGKRGCKWGFLTFYTLCRYLSVVTVVTTLILVNAPGLLNHAALVCLNQASFLLSLGFSFSIMTIKTVAMWKQIHVCWVMAVSHGVLWGVILHAVCKVHYWPATFAPPVILTALCFYMSTVILILSVAGAISSRRGAGEDRNLLSECMLQGVHCFLPIWVSTIICAIASFVSSNCVVTFITAYVSYISCPVGQYCVVWKLCKSTYLNGVKYISLEVSTGVKPTLATGSGTFCPFSRQANDANSSVAMDTFRVHSTDPAFRSG